MSVDRAREVSSTRGTSLRRELALYVVHGVLHLCGFDDHKDRDRTEMRVAECAVLESLGYADEPSGEHEWS
ncbi:MAG: rRNA maturation RNase YbeY [bacterium]